MTAQCEATVERTGKRCARRAAPGESLCGPHLRRSHAAFSAERVDRLVALLQAGNTPTAATRAAGLSRRTYDSWMRLGAAGEEPYASFRARVETAHSEGEARQVTQIASASKDDWRAGAWLLDRRFGGDDDDSSEPLDVTAVATAAEAAARAEAEATLEAIGEVVSLSAGAVARYAAAVGAWAALEAQWKHAGRPGTALGGATGTAQVPHPLIAQIAVARREAAQLGAALGLDPLGRWKMQRRTGAGRPAGAASAPDRSTPVEPGRPGRTLRAVPD